MKADRWKRIRELFEACVDLPRGERDAYLERECGDASSLRRQVESLILLDRDDEGSLVTPVRAAAERLGDELAAPCPGQRVGAYELVREIGRGGMGVVYLGRRADRQYQKEVAIKMVRHAEVHDEVVKRFRIERQILANLEHPNIARLIDGGSADGLLYLVLEFVHGTPIDAYCREANLTLHARLQLIQKLCAAIQYAHRSLVIHRDLKPGNILVTPEGEPMLLDFGIAKLLEIPDDATAGSLTQTAMRLLTPRYASPEQVRGEPVTTSTDVYSLGLLMYELLTDRPPYGIDSGGFAEWQRVICETQPAPPSQAATAPRRRRQLAGDLDNIVLMALRKEPERRYGSAAELADDIQRYLDRQPVAARPDTLGYRLRKFLQRNTLGVVAASVVVVALLAGAGAATYGLIKARRSEARALEAETKAREEAATAQASADFLADMFGAAGPEDSRGEDLTAREILDRGVVRVREELRDQPGLQSWLMNAIGNVYKELGLFDTAGEVFREGLSMLEEGAPDHVNRAFLLMNLGSVYQEKGEYEQAEERMKEAVAVRMAIDGEESGWTAGTLNHLAMLQVRRGRYNKAESNFRRAISTWVRILGPDHRVTVLGGANLANLYVVADRPRDAEPLLRAALEWFEEHEPDSPIRSRLLADTGRLAHVLGDLERADELLLRAEEALVPVFGAEHRFVVEAVFDRGEVLTALERYEEAEALHRRCLEIRRSSFGPEHPNVAASLRSLGQIALETSRLDEADRLLRRARAIEKQALGENHPHYAVTLSVLGETCARRGRFEEAEHLFKRALAIQEAEGLKSDREETLVRYAALLEATGRPEEAADIAAQLERVRSALDAEAGGQNPNPPPKSSH